MEKVENLTEISLTIEAMPFSYFSHVNYVFFVRL